MALTIAIVLALMLTLAVLELWMFWRLGEREARRRIRHGDPNGRLGLPTCDCDCDCEQMIAASVSGGTRTSPGCTSCVAARTTSELTIGARQSARYVLAQRSSQSQSHLGPHFAGEVSRPRRA